MKPPPPPAAPTPAEATSFVREHLEVILIVLGVIVLVALVALLIWWLRKRKKAKAARPAPLPRHRLTGVWRRFLTELPDAARAHVANSPSVVVLGPAGSGKSRVIDAEIDWRAQAEELFASHTSDPLLQLYVGEALVVQELGAPLLDDASGEARRALTALWQTTFRWRAPTALVVLDGEALARTPPDELRHQALWMRGKLNLLGAIAGMPIATSICLTRLDEVPGFSDLARLLCQRGALLSLPLEDESAALGDALEEQQRYLPLALTALDVAAFGRVVGLYAELAARFDALVGFLGVLREPSRFAPPPRLRELHLFSPASDERVGRPFAGAGATDPSGLTAQHRRRHGWRAAALGACLLLPFTLAAPCQYSRVRHAASAVATLKQTLPADDPLAGATASAAGLVTAGPVAPRLLSSDVQTDLVSAARAVTRLRTPAVLWWLPHGTFASTRATLAAELGDLLRTTFFLPVLEAPDEHTTRERMLYVLALAYARRGDLPAVSDAEWTAAVELPAEVVTAYLTAADRNWPGPVTLGQPSRLATVGDADSDLGVWANYLGMLQRSIGQSEISAATLTELREHAVSLLAALERSARYRSARAVCRWVAQRQPSEAESLCGRDLAKLTTLAWLTHNQAVLRPLLIMVRDTRVGTTLAGASQLGLTPLLAQLTTLAKESDAASAEYHLDLGQQSFDVRQHDWLQLLERSIIAAFRRGQRYPFFDTGTAPPVVPDGGAVVARKDKDDDEDDDDDKDVNSIFTPAAFNQQARPALDQFYKGLPDAKLDSADAAALTGYVQAELSRYATRYAQLLSARYESYQFPSTGSLTHALRQLAESRSPLADMLREVATRANLGDLKAAYYAPLATALARFQPVVSLMTPDPKTGNYVDLGKYENIVVAMARDLDGGANTAPLTPSGALALAMLYEPTTSYLGKADAWLDNQGLEDDDLRAPFLEPFLRVRDVGVASAERALAQKWTEEKARDLAPLAACVPFARRADCEADPPALEVLRHPDGRFWQFVTTIAAQVCAETSGTWGPRHAADSSVSLLLPRDLVPTLNWATQLAATLWDKTGAPQALALGIKPLPLPQLDGGDVVTLAQLQSGAALLAGFNQEPGWQPFALAWASAQSSSLRIEVTAPGGAGKRSQMLTVPASTWSFYALLNRGRTGADHVVTWTLPADHAGGRAREIRFALERDPWALFKMPSP